MEIVPLFIPTMVRGGAAGQIALPAGFPWPLATYPITFGFSNGVYTANFDPRPYNAGLRLGQPTLFANLGTGSDANNGLTPATAVKSIFKATQLGNATNLPFYVQIDASGGTSFPRDNNFTNVGTPVPNTQEAAYVVVNGTIDCWSGSNLAFPSSNDVTFPNTYSLTRSAVARVLNTVTLDVNGDYTEYPKVADAATCDATRPSWAQVGTTLYINTIGNVAPTTSDTRVLLQSTPNFANAVTSKSVYFENINFIGGQAGAVSMGNIATMNLGAKNCSAKFGGSTVDAANGWRLDNITGIASLQNCVGSCNESDGINSHWTPGGTPGLYTLTINCIGRNNGRDTVTSCNGLTSHDGIISIDVNGEYYGNFGANVIPILSCQMFGLGIYSHDSQGDVSHGGVTVPTDYQTQNTATMYLQSCRSATSTNALLASNTSTIRIRNFQPTAGQAIVQQTGATISAF